MAQVVLQAEKISKSFDKPILVDLNLAIKEGETHVIMGKSGEGKSTLLKILSGLIAPNSGEVIFEGERLDNPQEVLVAGYEELAYVAQNFNLLHNRTVLENLKDALLAFKDEFAQKQIRQLLQMMRLEDVSTYKIEKLSGGEKQRLAIARALATQPAVLLLDEPFTQLDFLTRQILLDSIKEIKKELATSIILVSHNLYEAFYLADIVHILDEGQLIRSDSPINIYEKPELLKVASILGEVNVIPPKTLHNSQQASLGIWSENIIVHDKPFENSDFSVQLKLKECLFLGNYFRLAFQLNKGTSLVAKSNAGNLQPGKEYFIGFPQKHLFELKD